MQEIIKKPTNIKTGAVACAGIDKKSGAKKNGTTLVSVIMRAPNSPWTAPDANEYTDTTRILNYCFENYKRYEIGTTTEIGRAHV